MTKKTFDCVEMKRAAAGKLAETLAGMSRQEELAFWQDRTRQLRKRQQEVSAQGVRSRIPRGQSAAGGTHPTHLTGWKACPTEE